MRNNNLKLSPRQKRQKLKNDLIYIGVCLLVFFARLLPRRLGVALFGFLGSIVYYIPTKEKARTLQNLQFIYGNKKSQKQLYSIAKGVFREIGKNLFDSIKIPSWTLSDLNRWVVHDDLTPFRKAYERGKGVIVITGHIGCFELLLHFFALKGFPSFAIGTELYDKRLERLVAKLRRGDNIRYIHRNDGRQILKLLKEGWAMGVLIDQDTKTNGVFAHFLGHLAYTPSAIVKIAMRFSIPLFVVTVVRKSLTTHMVRIGEEVKLILNGHFDTALVYNLETINSILSNTIEQYPEQWVWMHRRWRRKPTDKGMEGIANIELLNNAQANNSGLVTAGK